MSRNETIENYLESDLILSETKNPIRAIDIADYLSFSRPTVSIALKQLSADGYITINNNNISLTKEGLKIASKMYERHRLIGKLLIHLGVEENQAYEDACLIEHDISSESFNALKKLTEDLNIK